MTLTPTQVRSMVVDLQAAVALIERTCPNGAHHAEMTVRSLRWHVAKLRESEQSTQVYRREQR